MINSFGNLSGFAGPYVPGWLQDLTEDAQSGLWVVAVMMTMSGLIALGFRRSTRERVPPGGDPA